MENIYILHVVGKMGSGGVESFILNIYNNIDRDKYKFGFVVHTKKKQVHDDLILSLGGELLRVPRLRFYNIISYIYHWVLLLLRNKKYTIIHGHMTSTAIIYGLIALIFRKKIIVHSHSTRTDHGVNKYIKNIFHFPLRYITKNRLACSQEAGLSTFGHRKNFTVINNAIDTQKYKFNIDKRTNLRNSYNINNRIVIGHVGRLNSIKRQSFILDIMHYLIYDLDRKDFYFLCVGEGPDLEKLKLKASKLKISDNVKFLGYQSNINDIMNAMDIIVFPSLYEGLPLVLVEAQCSGLMCVISENISNDVNLTNLIIRRSIESNEVVWGETVANINLSYSRNMYANLLNEREYDLHSLINKLSKYYESR